MKLYGGKKPNFTRQQQTPPSASRPVQKKKMTSSTKLMIAIIALIAAIAVLVGVYFWMFVQSPSQRPERTTTASATSSAIATTTTKPQQTTSGAAAATTTAGPSQAELEQEVLDMTEEIDVSGANYKDGFFTMLVAGTDEDGIRTDTIIVATFDTNNKTVAMLNVPRDTLSRSKSGTSHKINNAFNNGVERTKVELKNLLGFAIDKYVILDFDAFEEIVDAIGGVEIDVPVNMNYRDPDQDLVINIKKGLQTLDGENALHYMRFRGYANADIDRINAQQAFYKALAKKMATPSTLLKLPALADVVFENVSTDLTIGEIIWLGVNYITMDTSTIITETLPHTAKYINGISYVIPSRSGILKMVNQYFNPYTEKITNINLAEVPVQSTKATSAAATADPDTSSDGDTPNDDEIVRDPIPEGLPTGDNATGGTPVVPNGGTTAAPSGGSIHIDENGNVISGGNSGNANSNETPDWLRPQATTSSGNTVQ